jgi:hypothetical protein
MESHIFHHVQIKICKQSLKETKILQDIITLELISSSTQAKISSLKNPHIKIDLLPRGQIPLKLIYTFNTILPKVISNNLGGQLS